MAMVVMVMIVMNGDVAGCDDDGDKNGSDDVATPPSQTVTANDPRGPDET